MLLFEVLFEVFHLFLFFLQTDATEDYMYEYILVAQKAQLHICERCRRYSSETYGVPCDRCMEVLSTGWSKKILAGFQNIDWTKNVNAVGESIGGANGKY